MEKELLDLIGSLEENAYYNCFLFDLTLYLDPDILSVMNKNKDQKYKSNDRGRKCKPIDKDQQYKDKVRRAADEFEDFMRASLNDALIIFETTSNLNKTCWNKNLKRKPNQVRELLRVLKARNSPVTDVFIFIIHDGQKNPYLADFQKPIVHKVESLTEQQKKLYFPGFIYVYFDVVCELKPIISRQRTRIVKTLKKSKARITELTKENEQLIKQGNVHSNDIRRLTKENDELIREIKDMAKKNQKLSKENDDLAKKFKAVDELLSQMIQGMKKSPKSKRKSRSESEDISPESFVLPNR